MQSEPVATSAELAVSVRDAGVSPAQVNVPAPVADHLSRPTGVLRQSSVIFCRPGGRVQLTQRGVANLPARIEIGRVEGV